MRYGLMLPLRAGARRCATIGRLGAVATLSAVLATALVTGCSWQNTTTTAPPSPPAAPDAPHVITNLSQLSSGNADTAALDDAAKVLNSNRSRNETLAALEHGRQRYTPSTLRRLFLDDPASPRYAETEIPHTEERLLNAKAAEYPGFASRMLSQLLSEMVKEEKLEPLVRLELSEEIRPIIVIAILDDKGQLKELIYQQHSGLAVIDNFVIASCKASLWANNMPKGAILKDGTYRLRIEAQLSKYSATSDGKQTFVTRAGLGIL
ncbi:MAG TPA: hypothetical protein VNE82_24550 [Candidatus Binataceae bacterium]|nr:hypothetical protein [Candidatus Binataceae bacterium]